MKGDVYKMRRKIRKWIFRNVVVKAIDKRIAEYGKEDEFASFKVYAYMDIIFNDYNLKLQYRTYRAICTFLLP